MIQHIFKAKVLLLAVCLFCAVGYINQVQAQSTTSATPVEALNQSEKEEFADDLRTVVEDVQSNSSYSEYERNLRIHFYKQVGINVIRNGMGVSKAIDKAIVPTMEYAKRFDQGSSTNGNDSLSKGGSGGIFQEIADEARANLL